jgi:PleD family two-component response regulator
MSVNAILQRVGRRILTLQQDLINAREELRFQATHDLLTGIWNRGAVLDLLHRELERAARAQTPTSVPMLIWTTSKGSMTPMDI